MVQIAGIYQHVKNENFIEYLVALGIPEDKAKAVNTLTPKLEVVVDGNKISLNSNSGVNNASSTFVLDEEIDEPLPTNLILKSTAKLDDDTLTINSKTPDGKVGSRIYEFSDAELVLTLSSEDNNVKPAKRYYKRV